MTWSNYLYEKTGDEPTQAFQALSNSVTLLNLGENYLGNKNAAELTEVFKAIPASITTFHLSGNGFSTKQIKTLLAVLDSRKDVHLDFGKDRIDQQLKEEIHAINMNRSLLGHLFYNNAFFRPLLPCVRISQAATSSAQP